MREVGNADKSDNDVNHGIWPWAHSRQRLYELADWAAKGAYSFDLAEFKSGLDAALAAGSPHQVP